MEAPSPAHLVDAELADLAWYYSLPEEKRKKLGGLMTVERDAPKVGRNDPCPCGSGRKFKRCCLLA
jgi:uncharacterized protein YecA (UPF0149 family)